VFFLPEHSRHSIKALEQLREYGRIKGTPMDIEEIQASNPDPCDQMVKEQLYSEDEWNEILRAASLAGMKPDSYVRACVLTQTREINQRTRHLKVAKQGN
jgi:hypothetical protein